MDTFPIPARSLERYFKVDGRNLERCYKEHLSGFREWEQLEHASDWMLLPWNMGKHLSIDESMHGKDLFTFLSNKDGHGKYGTLIAAVRGTKSEDVVKQLMQIPQELREVVKEVTMDFSDSMETIVRQCFPNATIVHRLLSYHQTSVRRHGRDAHALQAQGRKRAEEGRAGVQQKEGTTEEGQSILSEETST